MTFFNNELNRGKIVLVGLLEERIKEGHLPWRIKPFGEEFAIFDKESKPIMVSGSVASLEDILRLTLRLQGLLSGNEIESYLVAA